MLSKKYNVQLIATVFALAFASVSAHETTLTKTQQLEIQHNLQEDIDDNTDAYAIPSDSSAVEQEEEINEMKKLEKVPAPVAPVAPVKK